jgi:LmbE family N-acetylglucosaminyl deacetylase
LSEGAGRTRGQVVHILAHFDDEYCALPLIWEAARQGLAQRFIYLADYRDPALGARRLAETRAFLRRQGIAAEAVTPLGLGSGAYDQSLHRSVDRLFPRLVETAAATPVVRLVVPAWEGGHMDHDACAFMAVRLAARLGAPEVRQFTLYNGPRRPGPLLRGGAPLAENGPVTPIPLTGRELLRWMAAVRAFPSQAYAWSGIWPAMFAGVLRRGFGWQALATERVEARPHRGWLFYERMFRVPYAEVRAALDAAETCRPPRRVGSSAT